MSEWKHAHHTYVRYDAGMTPCWYAECECGWRSADHNTEDEAENEATGHQVVAWKEQVNMSVEIKEGEGPFVIDRSLPTGVFERVPGTYELASLDGEHHATFATAEEAEQTLREHVPGGTLAAYDWTILPERMAVGEG